MSDPRPFTVDIAQSELDDLRARLALTRFPEKETVEDWNQGVPLAYVRELVEYWREGYDWRGCEAWLNGLPNFLIEIDGLDIHFIHVRSSNPQARPLLITHGWPGSVLEFREVVGPLSEDFHLVIPSLPGYGFSGKPEAAGWDVQRIARAWHVLMAALGYRRWFAQGGDWGAAVTTAIGSQSLGGCAGIHLNMLVGRPDPETMDDLTAKEKAGLARGKWYQDEQAGYSKQQSTKPQTIGYALTDSPVGQLAWIVEKLRDWTDCDGHPETIIARDRILDDVTLYWLTASAASSARLYWESFANFGNGEVAIPTGCSQFPKELGYLSRRWAEQRYKNIAYWSELPKGGHFAALEQPELFVNELRSCFGAMTL